MKITFNLKLDASDSSETSVFINRNSRFHAVKGQIFEDNSITVIVCTCARTHYIPVARRRSVISSDGHASLEE